MCSQRTQTGMQLINLTKQYYSHSKLKCHSQHTMAVNGLTLSIDEGITLCILGHNGAGKSSAINMLVGSTLPTSGMGRIMGKDIVTDRMAIQKLTGVCPQHDILWGELTGWEHLTTFALIKGVPQRKVKDEVEDKLAVVGLVEVGNNRVSSYSGGMKRRLSVAIAMIANPKVIILDEPTTGMDPVNKQNVWEMVQQLKANRLVIITTHDMAEAELLGDKIAIMSQGKLIAVGNGLHLKSRFASGHEVSIICTNESDKAQTAKEIGNIAPDAMVTIIDLTLRILVRQSQGTTLSTLVRWLENRKLDWGIMCHSLEDVFMHVTHHMQDSLSSMDHIATMPTAESQQIKDCKHSNTAMIRAIFRKDFTLQLRQKGTTLCQVLAPITVIVVLAILQVIPNPYAQSNSKITVAPPILLNPTFYTVFSFPGSIHYAWCEEYMMFAVPDEISGVVGTLVNSSSKSGFLGKIPQLDNGSCKSIYLNKVAYVPTFARAESTTAIQAAISKYFHIFGEHTYSEDLTLRDPPQVPDAMMEFKVADTEGHLSYVFAVNDYPLKYYQRPNFFIMAVGVTINIDKVAYYTALMFREKRLAAMSMINDAFIAYTTNISYGAANQKAVQPMPFKGDQSLVSTIEVYGSLLYPIALSLQLPVYLFAIVLEKSAKLRELMQMHGLPKRLYQLSHILFCLILYIGVTSGFYISGLALKLRLFTQTNSIVLSTLLFVWGNVLVSLSMLMSSIIKSTKTATVIGYTISLLGTLISIIIMVMVYSPSDRVPLFYLIWPQFAFVRALYLMNYSCSVLFQGYGSFHSISPHDEFITCLVALITSSIVFYALYLYLDEVIPRQFGVHKSPFFCFEFTEQRKLRHDLRTMFDINSDVDLEKQKVLTHFNSTPPLVVKGLGKTYQKNVALKELYLSVEAGECFALLGENGAGKSTAISILTGLHPPTEGTARINGHDIVTQMNKVQLDIGVCPQFNVLWDQLTVREHFLFYARLKGIQPQQEGEHVQRWLSQMNLEFVADRLISALSGGMKRRVSIGNALIGNPKVVFLDEPSAGLDPENRRQLWEILMDKQTRTGRAIVFTTHSMEEAEVLSTRIGIMAKGTMRCIGTPQHLRTSVANMFSLKITFSPDFGRDRIAQEFVSTHMPSANKIRSFRGYMEFHISVASVKVSTAIEVMETSSKKHGIEDWSISFVGLDEVFRKVVQQSHNT